MCLKTAEAILLQLADNKEITVKEGDKVPLDDKKLARIANINVQNQTVAFVTGSETNISSTINFKVKMIKIK